MSDRELEQQLAEAGNKLLHPPSSLDELLPLLDRVESFLSRVVQSPPKSMHDALSPLMKALVVDELLMHSDIDVKVAVASCISEITRITAPDAPYDDDKMKDIFHVIVSSFENLHDETSRSYSKRVNVLETVAKVRSCVIMLDLECDRLIIEMFQHFLKEIRDYHSETIFTYMATIMTLVLEESDEVSLKLLAPLLATVKKDSEEVAPIAKKLGETVFANCAPKVKPYLTQAVDSLDLSLDEYNKSLNSVLEGTHLAVEHDNDTSLRDQSVAESVREEACSDDVEHAVNKSSKSVKSNGASENNGKSAAQAESGDLQDAAVKMISKSDSDDSMASKSVKSESRSEQTTKESGRKENSLINSAESSDQAPNDHEKEAEEILECRENENKDSESSTSDDPAFEGSNSLEKETKATLQQSTPKESEEEAVNIAPTSPRQSLADESVLKNVVKKGRSKKKKGSNKKQRVSKAVSEGTENLEANEVSRPSEKTLSESSHEENEGGSTGKAEAITPKQSSKKNEPGVKIRDGPSTKKKEDGKKRGPAEARLEKETSPDSPDESAKDKDNQEETPRVSAKRKRMSDKDRVSEKVTSPESPDESSKDEGNQEETLMASAKRKRVLDKEKEPEDVKYDKSLVGAKIKVWWPDDLEFYEGVISAYDSRRRKYTVSYDDGETEVLNLKNERWKFVQGNEVSEEEEVASPDASPEVQKKKGRTIAEPLGKHVEALPKSNSKGKSAKSGGRKSKDEGKSEPSLKEGTSKSDERTEDAPGSKSKAQAQKSSGKSVDNTEKASARSKVDSTSKSKSEQETPSKATTTKSKGKTPQSGSKPNTNTTGKAKSSSSKVKETTGQKESSSSKVKETTGQKEKLTDSVKTPNSPKGKSSGSSKARASETKSGNKRARGKR